MTPWGSLIRLWSLRGGVGRGASPASGLGTGRSETEKVRVMVEEPRISGHAEPCKWFLLPPCLFPHVYSARDLKGHLAFL